METLLIVCGAIITISGALAAIVKFVVKPLKNIDSKLEKIDKIEKGQKVLGKSLAQMMEHTITGNNIKELEAEYKRMRDYFIDN